MKGDMTMTIINKINKSHIDHSTRTELALVDDNTIVMSRVIDSALYQVTKTSDEPITVSQVARLTKLDNDTFKMIAQN